MRREEYLYVLKNKDYSEWVTKNQLPGKDDQVFVNGILEKAFLSEEELKRLNKIIKYEKGVYYKNQIVLDEEGTGEKNEFELSQPGWYEIAISAAGGRTKDISKNFLNDLGKVLYWKRENTALSCFIKFYEDFTWLLVDQIGGSDENGVYNCRKGTFLLSEKILILNQTHVSSTPIDGFKKFDDINKVTIPEEAPLIDNWNNFYSKADKDVFDINKNKIDAIDWTENNVEMFDYSILFFNYKTDGNLSIFRKLNFTKNLKNIFSAQNTGHIKEYLSFYDTDDKNIYLKDLIYRNENYYYITKAMSFMEKEPRNRVFGINGEDYLEPGALQSVNGFRDYGADADKVPLVYNKGYYPGFTVMPGYRKDNTEVLKWLEVDSNGDIIDKTNEAGYKTGSWSIKNFPNGIPNTNISPAGDGGYFRFYININEKKTLEYLLGKKYENSANAGGQGSYLKIKEDANNYVFVGGGGLAYEREVDEKYLGGYSTIGNNQDVLNGGGSIANRINNNKDYVNYTGTVSLGGGCLSEKNDFKTNTDINEEIDQSIGPSYKEGGKTNTLQNLHGKTSSQFLGSEAHVNVGLGGFGSGIFKNTEWLCTYREPENGKLSVRFLGPPSSQVYNVNYTYTKQQGAPNGTGRIADINDEETWCQVDLVEGTNVPAGTPMNIRFFHSNSDKEIKVELKMWQDGQFESPEAEEEFKNNPDNWISYEDTFNPEVFLDSKYISFKKDRISNNIEELSFTTINKHILFRFTIIPRLFKIRVFGEDSEEIIKYEFSAERENPENPSEIQTKGHDEVLNFGVEEGYKVTLKVWYKDRDRGLNRSDIIYLSSLYEGHNAEKISGNLVTFDYDQNDRIDTMTFVVPRHDVKIDLTPVDVYKLEMKAMNTISKPAQNGLPPLVDAKILSIFVGYDINNMTQYDSAVDIEVNADQQIFVKLVFTTKRIRIDEDLTSFPPGTIVEKAGNSLTNSESAEIEQWFYFSMPRYSVSIPLYVELRTFLLNIIKDRHNILEIRSSTGSTEFEVGEKINLEFEIEKKYKLSEDSGVTINGTTYLLDGKVLSKKQFNVKINGIRNEIDIGEANGKNLGLGNYYVDFCEKSRSRIEDSETVYIDFIMQNNDVEVYFSPNFLLNSTVIDCRENEIKTFKAVNAGFYRLILAGCRTGNGGNGSDGGPRDTSSWQTPREYGNIIFSGLPGGKGGDGFYGGNGGKGSDATPWKLNLLLWSSFLPYDLFLLNGSGGGGGCGGSGFFAGKGTGGGTAGWSYAASGKSGNNGHSFLEHGYKDNSTSNTVNTYGDGGKKDYRAAPHQSTTNKFIKYRGAIIDCILFLNEGQFLTAVGSSGGDGGDGPPAKQHYCGAGGGGGGSGGEAMFAPKDKGTAFFCVENFKTKVFNDSMATKPFLQSAEQIYDKTSSSEEEYISKRKNGTFVITNIQNSESYFPIKALGGETGCYSTFSYELTKDNTVRDPDVQYVPYFHTQGSLLGHDSDDDDNRLSNVREDNVAYSTIPTESLYPSHIIIDSIEKKFKVNNGDIINVGGGAYPTTIESGADQYWKSYVTSKALAHNRLPLSGRSGNHLMTFSSYEDGNIIYTDGTKIISENFSYSNKIDYAYRVGMFLGSDFIPNDAGGIKIIYVGDYADKIIDTSSLPESIKTNISIKDLMICKEETYRWWEIDNIPYF